MIAETIVGIDPGLTGAIACILADGAVKVFDIPTIEMLGKKTVQRRVDAYELALLLAGLKNPRAVVEQVGSMGPNSKSKMSMDSLMRSLGAIEATLEIRGVPFESVAPRVWKSYFALDRRDGESQAQFKARSIEMAQRLYPTIVEDNSVVLQRHNNRAEAILLAHWGLSNARFFQG